jgi:hypothetical protein
MYRQKTKQISSFPDTALFIIFLAFIFFERHFYKPIEFGINKKFIGVDLAKWLERPTANKVVTVLDSVTASFDTV